MITILGLRKIIQSLLRLGLLLSVIDISSKTNSRRFGSSGFEFEWAFCITDTGRVTMKPIDLRVPGLVVH